MRNLLHYSWKQTLLPAPRLLAEERTRQPLLLPGVQQGVGQQADSYYGAREEFRLRLRKE